MVLKIYGTPQELAAFLALTGNGGMVAGVDAQPGTSPAVASAVSIDEAIARWRDVLAGEEKSVRTIEMYADRVRKLAAAQGWLTTAHVNYESTMAFFAARRRNDHGGKPWGNGACRQAMSAVRGFGRFLEQSGICERNPLGAIVLPKRSAQRHKHPFSAEEARLLLGASIRRSQRDKRANEYTPLIWATLFWTGLRHSEVQPPCRANPYGGLKWRDIVLDGPHPGIWTDPRWIGNKSKSRDWLPLHPRLALLLRDHSHAVASGNDLPVFPRHANRATWVDDRTSAGLPGVDADGRVLSVHAARATFCTWVGQLTLPEGLRDRLCRHDLGTSERVYTTRTRDEFAQAIAQLPDIWPESYPQSNTLNGSSLDGGGADGMLCPATSGHASTIEQRRSPDLPGRRCPNGQGERAHAEGRASR